MKFLKITFCAGLIALFVGCTKQVPNSKEQITRNNINIIEVTENTSVKNGDFKYQLSKNEKDFLDILKIDKYASLCSNQNKL